MSSHRMKYLQILAVIVLMAGCAPDSSPKMERYRQTRSLMGTTVSVDVCEDAADAGKIEPAYQKLWERLEDISWRMNVFDEKSEVSKINAAGTKPVAIAQDTYDVLRESLRHSQLTKGAFDITVWPLIELWKRGEKENILPPRPKILEVLQFTGSDKIRLGEGRQVQLVDPRVKVDLGGIAAGYAVDEAAGILRRHGIHNFFIDLGGDIYVGGYNCEGRLWRIGISDPRDRSRLMDVVALSDAAVTTSGNYEKYFEIQGERWSHIMNPVTGYPQKEVVSATVIAPTTLEADALATALCVMGGRAGIELIDRLPGDYAALVVTQPQAPRIQRFPSRKYGKYRARR